ALQRVTETDSDYESIITGLWLIVAHFAEQSGYLRPVPALSELCFKLFRQCAKAILNIQWQNLDEDSSVRQNFLVSLSNLHAKLVPFDFPRFHLLETLTENPWTNPTLAKIMGGEVESSDKQEVQDYIQQEDPIILQLRVDMMLKENCEEYALNLCNSCLIHPELATDLSLRITQLSLLYKMGHEDKLQEECQRLSIQDALRIIKELNVSGKQKELYTVLAQTFMVQNWIRPCDTDTSKELLRMWIRHQLLVDREHDQFKDSIWAMAKLSHSTEQIVIIIDVLREECGDTFLQLYVDMSIFALKVDKGQMETSIKEKNMDAAAARRADMASVCNKLSCLCHHASLKVGKICSLTSFALRPSQESFNKIGVFYGQGVDCCDKCGKDNQREANAINPATLYEVERLLNMLRPDYLNPDNTYPHIHVMCRRFLLESLRNAQAPQKPGFKPKGEDTVITQAEGPGRKKPALKASFVFEALSPQDFQDRQALLAKLRMQNVANLQPNSPYTGRVSYNKSSPAGNKSKDTLVSHPSSKASHQQKQQHLQNQQELYLSRLKQQLEKQGGTVHLAQSKSYNQPGTVQLQQQHQTIHTQQVSQIIQLALKKDPVALEQISKTAPAAVVQAIASIMKGNNVKSFSQQQPQQLSDAQSSLQDGAQSLPTVSTLLRPPAASSSQSQIRQQPVPRKYPRPQLYAQPIIVSTGASTMTHGRFHSQTANLESAPLNPNAPNQGSGSSQRVLATSAQQQRAESLSISKAHVQGVRQFMQSQLSALQAGQGSVTTTGSSMLGSTFGTTNDRVKTTVELAQQAAITRELKKQQQKQVRLSQEAVAFLSARNTIASGVPPVIGTINKQPRQEVHLSQHNFRQQPPPRQSGSNIFSSVESSFQTPQTPTGISQGSVLPSSDELLGSITGIDDTIINDLLQDSGLLSNTFPDIEVDVSGEDRGKISSTFSQLSASQANARAGSVYQNTQSLSRSMLASLSKGQTYQIKAGSASASSQSLQFQQQCQTSSASCISVNQQASPYGQQSPSSVGPQGLGQRQTSLAAAEQAHMDQINQQMKQEDIPGEMCMDASNNATYRCILCSLAFETLDLLREHVRNVCKPGLQSSSVYTSKIEQDKANSARAGLETTTVFQCLRCFELCISEAGIKQHRLTCKRVPTIPSDIKKEAAAASANKNKSRAGSSNKHSSVKTESGGSSRPHSRNSASVLSPQSTQKGSSNNPSGISSGTGVAVMLGSNSPQHIKSDTPQAVPSVSLVPTLPGRPQPNVSTLATSLPSSLAPNTQSSPLISFKHSEMSSSITSFQPPFTTAKHGTNIVTQNYALNQNIKMEIPEASSSPSPKLPSVKMEPKNEFCPVTKDTPNVNSPKYSEISGSGGSKFLKCNLCSQTLCSSSSFISHWKECVVKHKSVNKKKVQKEKPQAEPLSGKVLENVMRVIESVASGTFDKSGQLGDGNHHADVIKLKDPCFDQPQDTVSSADGDGVDSEVSWDSRATFENTTDSEKDKQKCFTEGRKQQKRKISQLKGISERQCIESQSKEENGAEAKSNHKTNCSRVAGTGSEEEDEDDASLSGSESGSSALQSTREAPPKLRDRKLLKPIQSFINETFISPYQHVSKRLAKVVEESVVSESTTSGAESDEDHLLCRACNKPLQSQRLLLEHYVSKHLQPYTVKVVADSSSYFCHLCQKTFQTFPLYMKHVPNHSSTIFQKMKIFNKSPRISLHRDRVVSQKGLGKTKKKNLSPKLAKALKSKKAATKSAANRLKRQMLILQGQVPPERLKFMNRQRNNFRTSSEDDYSSDASNLMFRSKKPMMKIRLPDGTFLKRRRGRPRKDLLPEDIVSEDQVETEESRQTSSPNTADEDFMTSDATVSASPPSTRGRKRSGNSDSFVSSSAKRRRHFSDSEGLPQQRKDAFLFEVDTDSNSTTLSISVQENGSVVPVNGEDKVNHLSQESCLEKLGILNKLKVRSLSKRQKERLKLCDLNPSVILDALDLDSLRVQSVDSDDSNSNHSKITTKRESAEIFINTESPKKTTFLDSYLSYISSCSKPLQKQSSSETSKSFERTMSVSLTDLKKDVHLPKSLKQTLSVSLTDLKECQEKDKTQHSESPEIETEDRPSSSQSDSSWRFPVRRCSVNLGQKVSLSDFEPESCEESEDKDHERAALKPGEPIVCLERNAEVESCVVSNILTAVVDPNTGSIARTDSAKDQSPVTGSPLSDYLEDQDTDNAQVISPNINKASKANTGKVTTGNSKAKDSNSRVSLSGSPATFETCSTESKLSKANVLEIEQTQVSGTKGSYLLSLPTLCPHKDKKREEDDVLILESSDDENKAAEENLKDMVIVVNNDFDDDNSVDDDDVIVIKEDKVSSGTDLQGKSDPGKSNINNDDRAPAPNITSTFEDISLQTINKPDSGLDNNPKDSQIASVLEESNISINATKIKDSLCDEKERCLDVCSEAKKDGQKPESSDNISSEEDVGRPDNVKEVGIKANSYEKINCDIVLSDLCDQSSEHRTGVISGPNINLLCQNGSNTLTDQPTNKLGLSEESMNDGFTSKVNTRSDVDVECVAYSSTFKNQNSSVDNGEKQSSELDANKYPFIEVKKVDFSGAEDSESRVTCDDATVTDGKFPVGLSVKAEDSSINLVGDEFKANQDQETHSGPESETGHEELTTFQADDRGGITPESSAENIEKCQLLEETQQQSIKTNEREGATKNPEEIDDNLIKHYVSSNMTQLNPIVISEQNQSFPAGESVVEDQSLDMSVPDDESQSDKEIIDKTLSRHRLTNSEDNKCSTDSNINLFYSNTCVQTASFQEKEAKDMDKDDTSRKVSKSNLLDKSSINSKSPGDQIKTNMAYECGQISRTANENQENNLSCIKKVPTEKDMKDKIAPATGSPILSNQDFLRPGNVNENPQILGNAVTQKGNRGVEGKTIPKLEQTSGEISVIKKTEQEIIARKTSLVMQHEICQPVENLEKTNHGKEKRKEESSNLDSNGCSAFNTNAVCQQKETNSPHTSKEAKVIDNQNEDLKLKGGRNEILFTDNFHQSSGFLPEFQKASAGSNTSETVTEFSRNNDANGKGSESKRGTKAASKSGVKVIKNSHLSLAAFIAERLCTPQADNENVSSVIDSPQDSPVLVESEPFSQESAPMKSEEDVQNGVSKPGIATPIVRQDDFTKPEKSLEDTLIGDKKPCHEEALQDATSVVGVGLVDYSCSSEENSRDVDSVLSKSETLIQPITLQSTAESEPTSTCCIDQQMSPQTPAKDVDQDVSSNKPDASAVANEEAQKSTCDIIDKKKDTVKEESVAFLTETKEPLHIDNQSGGDGHSHTDKNNDETKFENSNVNFKDSRLCLVSANALDEKILNKQSLPNQNLYSSDDSHETCQKLSDEMAQDGDVDLLQEEPEKFEDNKGDIEPSSFPDLNRQKKLENIDRSTKNESINDTLRGNEVCEAQYPSDPDKSNEKVEMLEGLSNMSTAPSLVQSSSLGHHSPHNNKKTKSPSHKKKNSQEISSDTDDGDDLSNFELVIEKDTSARSILSFPEKCKPSTVPPSKEALKANYMVCQIEDTPEKKVGVTTLMAPKPVFNPSPKKVLTGSKSLRKDVMNQFVWDDDSDEDNVRSSRDSTRAAKPSEVESKRIASKASLPVLQKPPSSGEMPQKRKNEEESPLDAVNRKRKALREKTETAPFTWDLEDNGEKSNGPMKILYVEDTIVTQETQVPLKKSACKTKINKALGVKRPGSLKVIKLPAKGEKDDSGKGGSVSSVLLQVKAALSGSSPSVTKVANVENSEDNIQVDDEISFKRGSLPSTPTDSPSSISLEVNTETTSNSTNRRRRKSGAAKCNCNSDLTGPPSSERKIGELSPKNQASLRSRHSSVESNRSDASTLSATHSLKKRERKVDETPHKKAGLVKVGNSTNPAQVVSAGNTPAARKDASTPKTRSSEAAVKAYNQKSLRNRGVNLLSGRKLTIGGKIFNSCPEQKAEKSIGKLKAPSTATPPNPPKAAAPLNKTLTPKSESKPAKRKSTMLQTPHEQAKKSSEVVGPKIKKRTLSESRTDGLTKAKPKSGGVIKTKSKIVSSVVNSKAKTVKSVVGKSKTISSVVRKAKTVVVNKAKTVSSVVRKAKTMPSAASKAKTVPSAVGKTKSVSSAICKAKTVSNTPGKAKPVSTAAGKTKSGVPLSKKLPSKNGNKTVSPINSKQLSKKSSVKAKTSSVPPKPVTKSAEKKVNHKKS
ncbi:zinc finger protein 292, partial [Elysia marginata]